MHSEIRTMNAKFHTLTASSYIELPLKMYKKRPLLNIKNERGHKYFVWSILAHKYNLDRLDHANGVSNYEPYEHEFNLGNIECPVPLN